LAELQAAIQAKDRTIEYLSQRVEKVRSNTLPLITEDSINKSASLKCILAQAQSLVDEVTARESFRQKASDAQSMY